MAAYGGMNHHNITDAAEAIEAEMLRLLTHAPNLSQISDSDYQIWHAEIKQKRAILRKGSRKDPTVRDPIVTGEGPHLRHHVHRKGR